jgi:hypothetical protein
MAWSEMPMSESIRQYVRKAKGILSSNWAGAYTMPAARLYPHQWNWDSGFIAIGYSHYDTKRAIQELTSLFRGQWKNGMVPQIVFNRNKLGLYFPEPDFWQTEGCDNVPDDLLTSGITMPPIHAVAALKIYENAKRPAEVMPFLEWIYPRLIASHRYLYEVRDPEGQGLVYIRHPWESGMDNSPTWDVLLRRIDLGAVDVPSYRRKDLSSGVQPEMRPRNEDYDRFVYLVDLFCRARYDEKAILDTCPFIVYEPLFNSILCAANEALIKIAELLDQPAREIEGWYEQTAGAIGKKLYHEEHGLFDSFDGVENRLLEVDTAAGFMPLFGGAATNEQAARLYEHLNSRSFCALHQGNCFTIPNYDTRKAGFDRKNYWRGPVWVNINWMLMQGLRRYGFQQKSDSVAKDILQLPLRFGFHEYYDSFDGKGYGSNDFSWTAALFLDTAYETYLKTGERSLISRVKRILWKEVVLNAGKPDPELQPATLSQEMLAAIRDIKANYYTPEGRVDYDAIRGSVQYSRYQRLAARLKDFDLLGLKNRNEKLAFWINLYNTIVVDGIIALGIASSVKEVIGFFSKIQYAIGGEHFSPDEMEHGILRANARPPMHAFKTFGARDPRRKLVLDTVDPRIHFALVCGARSCAPIRFYTSESIDQELHLATVGFINSSEVVVLPEENRMVLSMILKWYEKDFGGPSGVLNFVETYLVDQDKKEFLRHNKELVKIDYLPYDWNLNK